MLNISHTIDALLDRSVVAGYGRSGLWARRHLPGWPADPPRMDGRVALVTGARTGIGLAAAEGFARLGARVLAVARSDEAAAEAADRLTAAVPGAEVEGLACDLSRLQSVRELARGLAQRDRLDVVVHNAGVMPSRRERSADGHELMFATHVLGPFALTRWTRPLLEASAPSRVIFVSSGGMYARSVPCHDLESERVEYSPKGLYASTKREQVVLAELWARRLEDSGVVVSAMHPGWAATPGLGGAMPAFSALTRPIIRDAGQGADTIVWLGASPEVLSGSGGFWHDRRARPTRYRFGAGAEDGDCRERLWRYCEAAVGAFE
jgi:dehydrogenase/reductase SDR family protein 12